jgi:YidC/Oxa1 family membrane protein insertase
MEKRVLLAVILSFIVLYVSQALLPKPQPVERSATPAPASDPARQPPAAETPGAPGATAHVPGRPGAPETQPAAAPLVADDAERDVIVESDAVAAVFSNRGAVLKSWRLKGYLDSSGEPLDLIPQNVPQGSPRPFALSVDDGATTAVLQGALFRPSATHVRVASGSTLMFEYEDAGGLAARKTFAFDVANPYLMEFSADVKRDGTSLVPVVEWGAAIGSGITKASRMAVYAPPSQPIYSRAGDVTRVSQDSVHEHASLDGTFGFAGVDDHYFLSAAIGPAPMSLKYGRLDVPVADAPDNPARFTTWSVRFASSPSNAKFFLGPKDFDVLKSIDPYLTYAIDFGIFRWFVVPLHNALVWLHGYAGNWGWSIVLLTVIINLFMFPLRHKSVVSMRKMAEIQPEVKAIQERYKNLKMSDPARQKQNVEMMNLYRERGVNPASGCVPMLLTFPVLIGFYSMLSVAVELRGAPFILWIKDLSAHDPLFITPILMGATQFIQTKMTPVTGADPMQQKMMLFMPIIFTGMFVFMPSGLVLYWTVANIWAIGQQVVTNKLIGPPKPHTVRPPAERRVKTAGSGKSDQARARKGAGGAPAD